MSVVEAYGMSGVTYYVNSDGSVTRATGGTINLRNNNPGNIRYGEYARSQGAIGQSNGFAIFPTMANGTDAQTTLLKSSSYQNAPATNGYAEGTIGAAIYKYAPPSENDTRGYIKFIEQKTNFSGNDKLSSLSSSELEKLRSAMATHEGSEVPMYQSMGYLPENELNEIKENIRLAQEKSITDTFLKSPYVTDANVDLNNKTVEAYFKEGDFYEGNILDNYDNPTYHLKFWMIAPEDFEQYTQINDWNERRNFIYRPEVQQRSALIYESGVTTEWGINNVSIQSVIGMESRTRKTRVSRITMDVLEPNGCRLFDVIEYMSKSLGWKSKQSQPYFLEISFVGYARMDNPAGNGGSQQVIQYMHRNADGTQEMVDCRQLYCLSISDINAKFKYTGFEYRIEAVPIDAIAYNKDYYNTKGLIEYDNGIISLRTFLQHLEEELNKQMSKGLGKPLLEENLLGENDFYKFTYMGEDDPSINLGIIESSGEAAGKSAKFVIPAGQSIAQVIDQITRALETNNENSVSINDKAGTQLYQDFPNLLQVTSKVIYKGQSTKTGQKAFTIEYRIYPYYLSRLKWNNSTDYELIAKYTLEALYANGFVFKKRYDYVFTSENTQIIDLDFNIDVLWRCYSYDEASQNYNDTSGNVTTPVQSYGQPNQSLAYGVQYKQNSSNDSVYELLNTNTIEAYRYANNMSLLSDIDKNKNRINRADSVSTGTIIGSISSPVYSGVDTYVYEADNILEDTWSSPDNSNKTNLKNASIFNQLYETGNAVSLKMKIRGDPYWITDDTDEIFHGENSIYFTMKTPMLRQSGYNEDLAADSFGGGMEEVHTLSGIYNVISITHSFNKGQFTQEIEAVLNGNFRFRI